MDGYFITLPKHPSDFGGQVFGFLDKMIMYIVTGTAVLDFRVSPIFNHVSTFDGFNAKLIKRCVGILYNYVY